MPERAQRDELEGHELPGVGREGFNLGVCDLGVQMEIAWTRLELVQPRPQYGLAGKHLRNHLSRALVR